MKLYQDPGFKWTVASTLVLVSLFMMNSFSASAGNNPPLANPPSGSTSPTFTNVETASDVIVGQNVRVGNSIKPKTGTSLALDAEKINFTHALETLGDAIINGTLKTNTIAPISGTYVNVNGNLKSKSLWNSGALNASSFFLGKFDNQGALLDNFGGLSVGNNNTVQLLSSQSMKGSVSVESVDFSLPDKNSAIIQTPDNLKLVAPSITMAAPVAIDNKLTVGNQGIETPGSITGADITATGHIRAASIGDMWSNINGDPITVKSKGVASTTKYCPDKNYHMISCDIWYSNPQPWPTPNVYNGKAHIANYFIDRKTDLIGGHFCSATVWNQYDVPIIYNLQTTCFNPNE